MNFLLSLLILFSLNSILFGSENAEIKGKLLETLFPFPKDQDLIKNLIGNDLMIKIAGGSEPFCSIFGCEDDDDDEQCSIPPGAQCCEGFSYDSRSDLCRLEYEISR
ncbi:hypothetical protein NPIL_88821 [Nephila pilipes]|uniref:Spider venom protein n=1 Tax=Nephila pilipes TaxID=299642 RepID=A0A8X6N550_NEPPI|nr:hypothetical protein NPIL_88821 [Nephila pilipes]